MPFRINRDTLILCMICALDTLVTVFLVSRGIAREANPLMAVVISHSLLLFCAFKLVPLVPFVALVESYRQHNPRFVNAAVRAASFGYIGVYAALVVVANTPC